MALTPGIDPVRGPAYAGDSTGSLSYPLYLSHACLRIFQSYAYLPGDVNMVGGSWPACTTGPDVTYLVGSFKGPRNRCWLGGFWCSADANGDCTVTGNDVTYLVNVFRGIGSAKYCPHHPTLWPTSQDLPAEPPPGWPNCEGW